MKKRTGPMAPHECEMTRWLMDAVTMCTGQVTALVGSVRQQAGLPDRHICHEALRGGQAWVEFKREGNDLSGAQKLWMRRALAHGAFVCVATFMRDGTIRLRVLGHEQQFVMTQTVAQMKAAAAALDRPGLPGKEFVRAVRTVQDWWEDLRFKAKRA